MTQKVFMKESLSTQKQSKQLQLFFKSAVKFEKVEPEFKKYELINYLNNLDWSQPWDSGAQFSSICVYSATQDSYDPNILTEFVDNLVDVESGFYFKNKPADTRQLFNGR